MGGSPGGAYQEIAENALAVTGVQWVSVHHYDAARDRLRIMALAPLFSESVQRAVAQVRKLVPSWDPLAVENSPDVNEVHARAYRNVQTVAATLHDLGSGLLPAPVLTAIERTTGVRWGLVCPFTVEGELAGSMAFLSVGQLDAVVRQTCEAFARQAGLTLEKDQLASALREQLDELLSSRRLFIAADERLRKELALHLHGRVQTSLIAAGFILDRCETLLDEEPARVRDLIAEVKAEIDRVRDEEIREVSHLLHPSVVDVALAPALQALADRYADRFRVSVDVSEEVLELDRVGQNRIPPHLRLAAYRVVEEALANTSRHARASRVMLRLEVEDGALLLALTDDGLGFDPQATPRGLGLGGIDYRVGETGGRWELDSGPGAGTRIRAWLPLEG